MVHVRVAFFLDMHRLPNPSTYPHCTFSFSWTVVLPHLVAVGRPSGDACGGWVGEGLTGKENYLIVKRWKFTVWNYYQTDEPLQGVFYCDAITLPVLNIIYNPLKTAWSWCNTHFPYTLAREISGLVLNGLMHSRNTGLWLPVVYMYCSTIKDTKKLPS